MNHELCRACETARFCSQSGCIPEQDDRLTTPEKTGFAVWFAVLALSLISACALVGGWIWWVTK